MENAPTILCCAMGMDGGELQSDAQASTASGAELDAARNDFHRAFRHRSAKRVFFVTQALALIILLAAIVFAFWAARPGFNDEKVAEALRASREYGLAHIPEIAKRYAEPLSLKEEFLREYLTGNVDYHMDEACVEGLRVFYDMAARVGAIKSARSVEFL